MASPKPKSTPFKPSEPPEILEHDAAAALVMVTQVATRIEPQDLFAYYGYADQASNTYTMSLNSGIPEPAFENGRRSHRFWEGRYVFPNDELEQDREDRKHAIIINLCGGKLHFAPIGNHP